LERVQVVVGTRVGVGAGGSGGEDAVGPVGGGFAGVDLAGYVVDDVVGPGGGADGGDLGVDTGDAIDEDVGVGEVEARVEAEGHEGGCGVDEGGAADDAEDGVVGVGADGAGGVVGAAGSSGEGEGLGEVLALDPELEFSGGVAGVVADLEGGDDDGADGPGLLRGLRVRCGGQEECEDGECEDTEGVGAHGELLRAEAMDVSRVTQGRVDWERADYSEISRLQYRDLYARSRACPRSRERERRGSDVFPELFRWGCFTANK